MSLKAYKLNEAADKPLFQINGLFEYMLEDGDVDAKFCNFEDEDFFAWIRKKDLNTLEKIYKEILEGEYEGDDDEEEQEFNEHEFKETRKILDWLKKELADKDRVFYIFK